MSPEAEPKPIITRLPEAVEAEKAAAEQEAAEAEAARIAAEVEAAPVAPDE